MVGFFLLIGKQGSGKTLMATKLALDKYDADKSIRLFSNYALFNANFTYITFNKEIEQNKDKLDILDMLDKNPDYFNNSIMLIDELHLYLDAYDFLTKNNRRVQTFFSQLRKRNILLIGTSQYLMNIDIRIRRQCMSVFEMKRIKSSVFQVDTHEIDGSFTEYLHSHHVDLIDYYNRYDTNELIL